MQNKIAVLLPIYNKDKLEWFKLSFESVLNQKNVKFDVFLLCDGSLTPKLDKYIEKQEKENSNVKVFRFKENRGLPFVLNDGIKYGFENNYNLFFRMDADDICIEDRFQKQLNFLEKNPEIDIVGGAISEIDELNKSRKKTITYPKTHEECYDFFKKRDPLAHPAVLIKDTFFKKVGFYSEKHRQNQDTFLWYNGFLKGAKFSNINDVILNFRITQSFFSSRRSGIKRAKQMLADRKKINKDLNYGISANIYAYLFFLMTISPKLMKKIAYKIFR